MRRIYLGLFLAVLGVLSNSLAMNLFKASSSLEVDQPWYLRKRLLLATFLGVFLNATLAGVAFTMTPLSLIAPLQGLTIAVVVLFAAAGVGGHYETVSEHQWRGIGVTIVGLIVLISPILGIQTARNAISNMYCSNHRRPVTSSHCPQRRDHG